MSDDETRERAAEFIDSLATRFDVIKDRKGDPVPPFDRDETASITRFMLEMMDMMSRHGRLEGMRLWLDLEASSRKNVVALIGLLPLVAADAEANGREVLFVTPAGDSMSAARLDYRAFRILTTSVDFATWDEFASGRRDARDYWILGDVDWTTGAVSSELASKARDGVDKVLRDASARAIFMHVQGASAIREGGLAGGSSNAGGRRGCAAAALTILTTLAMLGAATAALL